MQQIMVRDLKSRKNHNTYNTDMNYLGYGMCKLCGSNKFHKLYMVWKFNTAVNQLRTFAEFKILHGEERNGNYGKIWVCMLATKKV